MSTQPTGRIESRAGALVLVIEREFRAPIEDVWAAVTDPERTARWIGGWTGDPASGRVLLRLAVEEGAPEEEMEIRECEPPRRLALVSQVGEERWAFELDLSEAGGVTTLVFTQPGVGATEAESVGPGWEYYLDRLVAAETGADPGQIDFDRDYYPAMQEHYRAQADR